MRQATDVFREGLRVGTDEVRALATARFGTRLAEVRQQRVLTRAEVGKALGASQRVVAYYEGEGGQPPGALLAHLARTLKVTSDELLGLKPATDKPSPKTARLLKRLQRITDLPAADQRSVLKLLDALHESRQRTTRPRSKARAAS